VFGKVLKNTYQFSNTEKYFSNNTCPNGISDVASTTNTLFKTNHKTFFKKQNTTL
jgi:hypothetical protein